MANEPDYYRLLGVEPTADQATIDAAYQGRSLRFRLGQLRDRAQAMSGPSQEEIEQAHAVLGNPEARALYDAAYFPDKVSRNRRRMPLWVWAIASIWIVAIAAVCVIGARSRLVDDGGAIGKVVATATATPPPVIAVASPPTSTTTAPTATQAPPPTATAQPSAQPVASAALASPTATVPASPTPTATLSTPSQTFRPTETPAPAPTATATAIPPTATAPPAPTVTAPTPTAVPVPPTEPPPPPLTEAPPEPTATAPPPFPATDRIGTSVPVNLRNGPGTGNASLGALAPGTLLAATGETANAGGYLWRRFRVQDGRIGWVRDIDVTAVR